MQFSSVFPERAVVFLSVVNTDGRGRGRGRGGGCGRARGGGRGQVRGGDAGEGSEGRAIFINADATVVGEVGGGTPVDGG